MSMTIYVDDRATAPIEIELDVEEMEEVIAPRLSANHNETFDSEEVELNAEEFEEVIAPRIALNHNETLVSDETAPPTLRPGDCLLVKERYMRPATICLFLILILAVLAPFGIATARGQELLWENRGQPEFYGYSLDIDGGENLIVSAGVARDLFGGQWFVRAVDRRTGATKWEDRFGPAIFGQARDVAIEDGRAFVAGFIYTPGRGFEFVVRAHDLSSGVLLWSQEVSRGLQCAAEAPGFARCVAKALAVHDGRVFAVGHLTRTAARSDFAVLAFDAATGTPLWESVTDATGTGSNDYAWAVSVKGDNVFVLGEIGDLSGLLLQSHDARTGAIRWQQRVPGALNGTLKHTLAADGHWVFIAGYDDQVRFMVQAYDAGTGALQWDDRVEEGIGQASALTVGDGRLFATGVAGCDPNTFLDCKLAVRAYDPRQGLLWQRADQARGGDWSFLTQPAVGAGQLFVGAQELLEDGQYHSKVLSYTANDGTPQSALLFDEGSGAPFGSLGAVLALNGRLFVGGGIERTFGGFDFDFVLRSYRTP